MALTTCDIYASGSYVHVAGVGSVRISTDGGATFAENAAHAAIGGVAASYVGGQGSYVYLDGLNSLEMPSDNGATITKRDQTNGFYNPHGLVSGVQNIVPSIFNLGQFSFIFLY